MSPSLFAILLSLAPADDPRQVATDVAALLDAGNVEEARARIDAAYAANPDPRFGFMRAALEEHVGRCEEAIPMYRAFLETADDPLDKREAEDGLARCGAPITEEEPVEPPPPVVEPPAAEPSPLPAAPPPKPWVRDGLGWGLSAGGVALAAGGGVLVALADASARAANDADLQSDYARERDRVRPRRIAGAALISAGAALFVGGVARFIVVKRRNSGSSATLSAK